MNEESGQDNLCRRIEFIKRQIDLLDDYLPETYQLLMHELDVQNRLLMEQRLQQYYQQEEL